jgi:hypothetical protein
MTEEENEQTHCYYDKYYSDYDVPRIALSTKQIDWLYN